MWLVFNEFDLPIIMGFCALLQRMGIGCVLPGLFQSGRVAGAASITPQYVSGKPKTYTYATVGRENGEVMKRLALKGNGREGENFSDWRTGILEL